MQKLTDSEGIQKVMKDQNVEQCSSWAEVINCKILPGLSREHSPGCDAATPVPPLSAAIKIHSAFISSCSEILLETLKY